MATASAETRQDSQEFDARCVTLIEEMSAGSEQALGALYDATLNKVYGVAVRIVGDSGLAEDVVSDVYYEAWRSASRYDPGRGRPVTWLMTICRNRALDEYRRMASASRTVHAAALLDVDEEVKEPDDILSAVEEGDAVHDLLLAISSNDRQLIALAFFRGMSHSQIAEHVGQPLGTVKSRIRRALKSLGEAMTSGVAE